MKRIFALFAVVGLVSGAVFAAAAGLTVNGGALQEGTDTTLQCDTDGINVTWVDTNSSPTTVEDVTVDGIDEDCVGATVHVTASPGGENCNAVIDTTGGIADDREETCTLSTAASVVTTTGVTAQIIGGGATP